MVSRRLVTVLACALVVAAVLPAASVLADTGTLHVNNQVSCDDATADSSVTPYCHLQAAIDDASTHDVIVIAPGTYTDPAARQAIIEDKDLTIVGAGEDQTFLDGSDLYGGFFITDSTVSVSDLTIQNLTTGDFGVAFKVFEDTGEANLDLTDVTIQEVTGPNSGGAITLFADTTGDLLRVTIQQVHSDGAGGAIWANNDTVLTITNSTIDHADADGNGGAILMGSGTAVTISASTFTNNTTDLDGGAIYSAGANATLRIDGGSTFYMNASIGDGGAVTWYSTGTAAFDVIDSTFDTNSTDTSAGNGGGAIMFGGVGLSVSGSTFVDNSSGRHGGAIADDQNGKTLIFNSTFIGNTAEDNGGAISGGGSYGNLTVTDNTATTGGGIADLGWNSTTIRNSIVHGNHASSASTDDVGYTIASGGHNIIGVTFGGFGSVASDQIGADPLLDVLTDNGGPTETIAIADTSPARDAGDPAAPGSGGTACEATDQRGYNRNDNQCDIGAFEYGATPEHFVLRYSGANRYGTAQAISEGDFPEPSTVDTVFLAVGTDFPDALAGAAVAGRMGAPLLLVQTGSIPGPTAAELTRLEPATIVILGGTAVISDSVKTTLEGLPWGPSVERLAGANRYATSVAISAYGFPGTASTVVIATGGAFADALAGGPAAVALHGPVLLTGPTSLPGVVAAEIQRLSPSHILVIGGTAAVSDAVFDELTALVANTDRISGANRYATAVAVAQEAFAGSERVYVATGLDFPDALAGAAAAGAYDAPILLVPGTSLPTVVSDEITALGATTVVVLGGTAVVTSGVEDSLRTLLGLPL